MSRKPSAVAAAYILNLPPAIQTAVKTDSLPPLESDDAITLLVYQTEARKQQSFADSVVRPPLARSAIECRLYEEVLVSDAAI